MTVNELKNKFKLKVLAGSNSLNNEVKGFYSCDLLSWVLGKAKSGDALLTVMGNVNSVAVATMIDLSCIILTEDSWLDKDAKQKADENNIPVLASKISTFELTKLICSDIL